MVTYDARGNVSDQLIFECRIHSSPEQTTDASSTMGDNQFDFVKATGILEEHMRSLALKIAMMDDQLPKLKPGRID